MTPALVVPYTYRRLDVLRSLWQHHPDLKLLNIHIIKAGAELHQQAQLALGPAVQEALKGQTVACVQQQAVQGTVYQGSTYWARGRKYV